MNIANLAIELVKDTASKLLPFPVPTIIRHVIGELTRQEERRPRPNQNLERYLERYGTKLEMSSETETSRE